MTSETSNALLRVTGKAIELHRSAPQPLEDLCGVLADWIVTEFEINPTEADTYLAKTAKNGV
jgi:hypothetical protein